MLTPKMLFSDEQEGNRVPGKLPAVIDAHVHVFPGVIFKAIWQWFNTHAWPIRYQMATSDLFDFLISCGIKHIVALQYAHKPGIARMLNQYLAEKCKAYPDQVTGMATVLPGEDGAVSILQQGFESGLGGLKLHVHVQCFDMNSDDTFQLFECCSKYKKPVVIHAGREPKSEAYKCDPYELCSAQKVEQILKDFPDLKLCVPHLGFDEIKAYKDLIEKYDNLWLDTTMAITDYFPIKDRIELKEYRSDRIMYGSDFPNIPYAWDRELKVLEDMNFTQEALERICHRNAVEFFNISI